MVEYFFASVVQLAFKKASTVIGSDLHLGSLNKGPKIMINRAHPPIRAVRFINLTRELAKIKVRYF